MLFTVWPRASRSCLKCSDPRASLASGHAGSRAMQETPTLRVPDLLLSPLRASSLPPAHGASRVWVFQPRRSPLFQSVLPSPGPLALTLDRSQGENRSLPAGWPGSPLSHLSAVVNPLGCYCLQPEHPPSRPWDYSESLVRACSPNPSDLVPSECDLKALFCFSWVGLWFQAYF